MPARRPPDRDGRGWDPTWPAPSKPIPVEGGLQARSQRGRIGDTWWSQRFIAVLESFGLGGRLQRGKHYARAGQVLHMEIAPGRVTSEVQGSRVKPYRVVIETRVLTPAEWDAAESVMAASAVFLAKLLAGEMPEEIEEAFAGSSGPLFPASADAIDATCSCPDWENPCKHIAAVYFLLAEAFDEDPFLILAWRGRAKAELLADLRSRRKDSGGKGRAADATSLPPAVAHAEEFGWPRMTAPGFDAATTSAMSATLAFWGRSEDIADIEVRPRRAVAPDLVLRQLDASPLGADGQRIVDELRRLYEAITDGAATEALGEP
jgi:uncharacterized Zn finger protein